MSSLANFNFSSSAVNKILKHTKNYGNTDCTCTMYHSHHKDAPRHEVVKSENALHTFNLHIRGKKVSASNLASARLHMNAATGNVVATTPPPISVTNTHTHCICPYSSGTYNNHLDVRVDETGSVHNITTTKKSLLGDTLGETTDNGLKFQPNHANQPEYGIGFVDWVLPVCFAPYDTSESNYFWGGGTPSCNDPGCTATFDACVAQWGAGSENACQDCQMTIGGSPGCILQTNDDGKGIYGTQPAPIGNLWTIRDKNGIIRYYADASANVFFSWSTVPHGPVTPSTEAFVIGKNGVTVGPVGNCSPHKKKDMLTETELTNTTCSVHGSSGHYINDSSGIATNYCCKISTSDSSGCTSGSTDDVCLDKTSHNSGSDACLSLKDRFTDCSGATPSPPSHFTCATASGSLPSLAFPNGNLTDDSRWRSNFPNASDLNIDIDKRAAGTAFGPTSYSWISGVSGSIDSIQLAKVWILATHGFKKTWTNGDIVHGGYPTCSRALSTAGMESGAAEHPFNEYDAHFYGPKNGCRSDIQGGCWQTSNDNAGPWPNCTKYNLTNPFCNALQAWGHKATMEGEESCDSSGGAIASYCTKEQLQTQQGGASGNGHNQGCEFGALCYGWGSGGWNSPLSGALFRLCGAEESVLPTLWPSSTNPPSSCDGWGKSGLEPKYNCEIAECACQQALKELKVDTDYSSLSFIENIDDKGYQSFIDACKAGPLSSEIE